MKRNNIAHETWFDLSEAAAYLGVHFTTLRRWADSGELVFVRTPGGRRRFAQKSLDAFLARISVAMTGSSDSALTVLGPFAERAIGHARESAQQLSSSGPWFKNLSEEQRKELKSTGHRLMVLLIQYNSRQDGGEAFLEEGMRIGREYSAVCAQIGLTLQQTVHVFLYFRRSILDTVHETGYLEQGQNREGLRVYHRTTDFLDQMLLDLIGSFPTLPAQP